MRLPWDATPIDSDEGISGRLVSRDDVNYHRLTVDELTIMTLPIDSDEELVVTVFDQQGNVVEQTTVGGAAAARLAGGGETGEALPLLGVAAVFVMRAGVTYVVRVSLSAAARSRAGAAVTAYVVRKVAVKSAIAIKRLLNRAQVRLEWGGMTSFDVKEHLDGDDSVIARSIVSTTPILSVRTRGRGRIRIVAGAEKVLGFTHNPGEASCGTGDDRSLTAFVKVELAWDQKVLGRTVFPSISLGELPITLTRFNAPRRIGDGTILVNVPRGASKTVTLTDYIEDSDGRPLTFAVSGVPSGWGVTTAGANLTFTASATAAPGSMTVTATDRGGKPGDCWNFPLRVTVNDFPIPEMVVVPGGSFLMGSSESCWQQSEGPVHQVSIRSFAVGKYEVTFEEWDACVSDGGCGGYRPGDAGWSRGRRPVINVNWHDAKSYVGWLSGKTGEAYRLLSESEWEYVARAGTTGLFHTGSTITPAQANYNGRSRCLPKPGCDPKVDYDCYEDENGLSRGRTLPVGSFAANAFGLHDVHGNVWEWVEDCWHFTYEGAPTDGSARVSGGTVDCRRRVVRGGSWYNGPPYSAIRDSSFAGNRNTNNGSGFRVARTLN